MNYTVDYSKIEEYKDDFIQFNDYLPLLIRDTIYFEYVEYLREHGDYNQVISECVSKRPLNYNQSIQELVEWCKNNPKYKDLIS